MGFCPIPPEYVHVHCTHTLNRGSNTSVDVLLNLSNGLRKNDIIRDLPSILLRFRNQFNKFNITGGKILDSIYIYHVM